MGLAEVIMKHTELGMKTQMLEVKVERTQTQAWVASWKHL